MGFPRYAVYGLAAALALGAAASAYGSGRPHKAALTGAVEVPGPGDPDGTGTATVRVNPATGEVCWEITVAKIAPATMAHLHQGGAGVAGGVVVALTPPSGGTSSGCKTVGEDQAAAIFENPGQYYVNVHNAEFPAGAIRGQLAARKLK